MSSFVHLHVHSHYSVLDGMSKIPALVDKSMKCGMYSIALTDHGNMYGIKEFVDYAGKVNSKTSSLIKDYEKVLAAADSTDEDKLKAQSEIDALKGKIFKPIIGVEAYCARRTLHDQDKDLKEINAETGKEQVVDQSGWHLIILAKNKQGYRNLCKLVSISWIDGFYYRPRIDKNILEKYSDGLIVCSACLGGEIPQLIIAGKLDEAEKSINWFKGVFGDDFYIEIQRHQTNKPDAETKTYQRQQEVIPHMLDLARRTGTKVVATNDVHFVEEQHAQAHDRLICLSTARDLDDPTRMRYTHQEWLKTPEEMAQIFSDVPEALANTLEIAHKVETYSIDSGPIMPRFDIPADFGTEEDYHQRFTTEELVSEFTRNEKGEEVLSSAEAEKKIAEIGGYDKLHRIKLEADYLAKLTWEGAKRRYGENISPEIAERIEFELHVMKTMGYPGYFLIVQDYIKVAREQFGVAVGPGRGSAAGSVVAYCLRITDIDPLKYNLLFERFLNPDRVSLPDIDVDFDDDGRAEVLRWVTNKYGKERVAHIITYGTMATKSSIKDVGRVQKVPLPVVNKLTSFIPDRFPDNLIDKNTGKPAKVTVENCLKYIPELTEAMQGNDPNVTSMLTYASELEDTVRQVGVHACGVIIGADDLTNLVPLATVKDKNTDEDVLVTQYDGHVVEKVGLIKMDFLGLSTLSVIKDAVVNIKESKGVDVDIDAIPIDDPKTYELYCKGMTVGTFQFESPGMQKYLRALRPSRFEDLIAMNALYRPGPMDYIPSFIARKHGKEPVKYDLPCMKQYLEETYGITVYQEQVMLLSRLLADFTRGESDQLRKAMGKKQRDELNKLKSKFMENGQKNGHDTKILEKIWADWEKFAAYAFNKSHATSYSWVAYQTAWLKAHYPSEYMAAVLSRSLDSITDVTKFMMECKNMGINVLGPDVNHSQNKFSVMPNGDVRFGLGAIKGMGGNAVANIIETRKDGKFKDVFDFAERVNMQVMNKKSLEALVLAGAFDNLSSLSRRAFLEPDAKGAVFVETLMRYGAKVQIERKSPQMTLFGEVGGLELPKPEAPAIEEWPAIEKLNHEKEVVGIYLSAHPLDDYKFEIENICSVTLAEMKDLTPLRDKDITFAGMVVDAKVALTKNGKNYGRITLEDYSDRYDVMLFGKDFETYRNFIYTGYMILVKGRVQQRTYGDTNELEFKIKTIQMLDTVRSKIKEMTITLNMRELDSVMVDELVSVVQAEKGKVTLKIKLVDVDNRISVDMFSRVFRIDITKKLLNFLADNELKYSVKWS